MKQIFVLIPSSEFNPCMGARVNDEEQHRLLKKFRGPEAAKSYQPQPLKGFNTYEEAKVARETAGKDEAFAGAGEYYTYDICVVDIAE